MFQPYRHPYQWTLSLIIWILRLWLVQTLLFLAFAGIPDEESEAHALGGLAVAYMLQGKFDIARTACMEAREIYSRNGHPMGKMCAKAWEQLQSHGTPTESLLPS